MEDAPKRRKLEKTADISQAAVTSQKYYCCRCGTAYSRRKGYFPVSHSPMYRKSGYLPWCNDCIEEMYDSYRSKLGDKDALRRMCMKLDLYWADAIYDMVDKTAGVQSRIRSYIGKTNLVRYIDKTFDDTIKEEAASGIAPSPSAAYIHNSEYTDTDVQIDQPTDQAIIDFWGAGFTHDFYMELERRYQNWTGGMEKEKSLQPAERALYQQICMQEAIISRSAAAGEPTDKAVNTLNNLLGSMNLKPAQRKDNADIELEKMPLGVGIQKWEYSRPLPETPKKNRDIRGVIKNITTWYLGHACKMVGLKNSYCKAYEDAMDELRVKRPEYDEEDDDSVLNDIFNSSNIAGDP